MTSEVSDVRNALKKEMMIYLAGVGVPGRGGLEYLAERGWSIWQRG